MVWWGGEGNHRPPGLEDLEGVGMNLWGRKVSFHQLREWHLENRLMMWKGNYIKEIE